MSRDIQFRGMKIGTAEWVYGYFYTDQRFIDGTPCVDVWIIREEDHADHMVTPSTIGQFTGLFDKNGVAIYEGDLLSHPLYDPHSGEVRFNDPKGCFSVWGYNLPAVYEQITNHSEVIGNIHQPAQEG